MLDIITNNPFRVLGVFSNAKQADILRNASKMKAYLNVGREVSFPSDMDFVLPPLTRDTNSAGKAQSDINLQSDRIRYALFWFCNASSMDDVALNNLFAGNIEKAVEIFEKRASFSSLVNSAVFASIQGQYSKALQYYAQLVHDSSCRTEFISAVCDATFQISEEGLMHIVIDELLKAEKPLTLRLALTDNADIAYLSETAIKEPISKINAAIATAKSVPATNAEASLRAGKTLIRNTKTALATVKRLSGSNSIEYQSAADNLAKQILQCGINYFNNSEDSDNVDKALEIQQYALSIAQGKLTKDRCKQNVDILLKKKEQAAYEADLAAIANELQSFQSAYPSISRARTLVNNCKPHLSVLRDNLGSENDLYIKISSAIANNALGMVVDVVNKAQNQSVIAANIASGSLATTIDSAISAMSLIGSLDMTSQERTRFNQNKATLQNLKSQLSSLSSRSSYTPSYSYSTPSSSNSSSKGSFADNHGCLIGILIWLIGGAIIGGIIVACDGDFGVGFIIAGFIALMIYGAIN